MFRYLRVKKREVILPDASALSGEWLAKDYQTPIRLQQINALVENLKRRVYRNVMPPSLLVRFNIDPISWKGADGEVKVGLSADPEKGIARIWARQSPDPASEFFRLEMADNQYGGIDIQLLLLHDPDGNTYRTDVDEQGQQTHFGTIRRNLGEEKRAMQAGLAPGQVRGSLGASRITFQQLDAFFIALGHKAYFLEPLTYASAWVFERRGFAYVRGHKLMNDINLEFQPGGALYQALGPDMPFRQPEQWSTVRGRAWAIHDGILEVIDAKWDNLRMVKQVGRHAGVETFLDAQY